jgi:hypothetical protein
LNSEEIRTRAERFSPQRFREELRAVVRELASPARAA